MSCGGTVIETIVLPDKVWINTREKPHYSDTTAIYVENTPEACCVSEGDTVWWQGSVAYWTAKDKDHRTIGKPEIKLTRRGSSGAARPKTEGATNA